MNTNFQFSKLLGTVCTGRNISFENVLVDGIQKHTKTLLLPVHNRVMMLDLMKNSNEMTFYGHGKRIELMAQRKNMLIIGSSDGYCTILSYPKGLVLRRLFFMTALMDIKFSEDGGLLAVVSRNEVRIYQVNENSTATVTSVPQLLDRVSESTKYSICKWVMNEYLCVGCYDGTSILLKLDRETGKIIEQVTLSGNKQEIIGIFFRQKEKEFAQSFYSYPLPEGEFFSVPNEIYIVDKSGVLVHWLKTEEKWTILSKVTLQRCSAVDIGFKTNLLVLTTFGGNCYLYDLDNLETVKKKIDLKSSIALTGAAFTPHEDWIVLSSYKDDALYVYDYDSDTFVLKQQGHKNVINQVAYSHIGDIVATGDKEGQIKVWDMKSGQCFVTLSTHSGPITGLTFSRPPNSRDVALFSSSLDGTCRAFDLLRYRNFRTFVSPSHIGFTSMSIDSSGELLAASGQEEFGIHIWNVVTSQLMDVLQAHEGPITDLKWSKLGTLASGSWDKTVRLWKVTGTTSSEVLEHRGEVICIAFRPDGGELCVSTSNGELSFWDAINSEMTSFIEGARDIKVAHQTGQEKTQVSVRSKRHYTSVCYTADGQCVLAGSVNQFINMYSVSHGVLLKQFIISTNMSFNSMIDVEHSHLYTNFKLMKHRYLSNKKFGGKIIGQQHLPGSQDDLIPDMRVESMSFSPTNREFIVATPEGVTVFNTERNHTYQPLDLDPSLTRHSVQQSLENEEYGPALIMALKLNDKSILETVFHACPENQISLVSRSIPMRFLHNFFQFLGEQLEKSIHLEVVLCWVKNILLAYGPQIQEENQSYLHSLTHTKSTGSSGFMAGLRSVLRGISTHQRELKHLSSENMYTLQYLQTFSTTKQTLKALQNEDKKEETNTEQLENGKKRKRSPSSQKRKRLKSLKDS